MNPRLKTLPDLVLTIDGSDLCRFAIISTPSFPVADFSFNLGSEDSLDTREGAARFDRDMDGCVEEDGNWDGTGTLEGRDIDWRLSKFVGRFCAILNVSYAVAFTRGVQFRVTV